MLGVRALGRRALNLRVGVASASAPGSALEAASCGGETAAIGAAAGACYHSQSSAAGVALPLRHAREACWTRQARAQMVTSSNASAAPAVMATPVVTEGQLVRGMCC
jgi:hypothetical protein